MESSPFPSRHDEVYTSSIATPELVGREEEIAQIERAIKDSKYSYIIYITGAGGIGKTVLVRHILEHIKNDVTILAVSSLIDLYHTNQRTPDGFQQAIQEKISPDGSGFQSYSKQYQQLQNDIIRSREKSVILQQRQKTQRAFFNDINQLAKTRRIVVAMDTAEKLFYEHDPLEEVLGVENEFYSFQKWLEKEFLAKVKKNIVVIIAGRPGTDDSFVESLKRVEKQVEVIRLKGLKEDAALAYYDAVAKHARSRNQPEDAGVAEAIRSFFTDEYRRVVFWGLCESENHEARVRPLLLSLALDYSVSAGRIMDALSQPLAKVKSLTEAERRQIEQQLTAEMGYWVRESHRPVVDEILRALAFTRKGAEPALIAHIADYDVKKVEQTLKKNEIRNLAFIKTRDNRFFLHDEMYDLLRRYAVQTAAGPYMLPDDVHNAINSYYKERIAKYNDLISKLYRETLEGDFSKANKLREAIDQRNDALVEDLHYQLRYSLETGFETYFCYAEESMLGDESLSQQLRAELLSLLADERRYAEKQGDQERIQEIDRFMQQKVIPDGAIRWVKWFVHLRSRSDKALEIISKLRTSAVRLLEHADELTKMDLDSYEGYSHALKGDDLPAADKLLNEKLIARIEKLPGLRNEPVHFNAVLARACNNLGYLARVEAKLIRAEHYYARAIPLWRFLKMPAQQAISVNNHAFALSLLGQHNTARRQAIDALQMRQELGLAGDIVLSLNTIAEIEIYAGNYREAQVHASEALSLAEKNTLPRPEGLACLTMATLSRFRSEPEHSPFAAKRHERLGRALEYSNRAYRIFSTKAPELERKIRALLEIGLAHRELYRLSLADGQDNVTLFIKAEKACQEALENAKSNKLWLLYLDAALSRCWLYYYHPQKRIDLPQILQSVSHEFDNYFPGYRISAAGYPSKGSDTVISVFTQLARMHTLAGILALENFESAGKQIPSQKLQEAAQQFSVAFEYDSLIARDFRDTIRASNLIYGRLKKYNPRELLEIYEGIRSALGDVLPQEKKHTELLFWQLLEEHFGTYEVIQKLAKDQSTFAIG
jgi:uridine kinase